MLILLISFFTSFLNFLCLKQFFPSKTFPILPFLRNGINGTNFLHMNISSICRNFDDLQALLAKINVKFSVVGITETGLKNHTCEKGGADLSISCWHLLMNFRPSQIIIFCARDFVGNSAHKRADVYDIHVTNNNMIRQ